MFPRRAYFLTSDVDKHSIYIGIHKTYTDIKKIEDDCDSLFGQFSDLKIP